MINSQIYIIYGLLVLAKKMAGKNISE